VVPVAYQYDPELQSINVGGHDFAKRKVDRSNVAVYRS
jgi:hypothetical protein